MSTYSRRDLLKVLGGTAGVTLLAACQPAATPAAAPTTVPAAAPPKAAGAAPTSAAPAQAAPPKVAQTGSTAAITYWGFSGDLGKTEQQLVEQFHQAQQDVRVEWQTQGSYEESAQKLTAALQARTAPDVALLSDVWWFKFYLNKVLLPLDDLIAAEKIDPQDYVQALYTEGVRDGKSYWLPHARSTPLFYYNKDAYAKAGLPDRGPKTWDEFTRDYVPKLKPLGMPFAHPGAASYIAWLFQGVIWQYGGEYSDAQFTIKLDEPAAIPPGDLYRTSVKEGWASTPKDLDPEFRSGTALSIMGSTGSLSGHESSSKFAVGTAFLPEGPAGFGCPTGGAGLSILAATPKEKQQAAMKWIDFATGKGNGWWSRNTGYMPVRTSVVNSPEMQEAFKQRPNLKTAVDQLPKTRAQDAARVFIPNGDQIIGKGLERITVNGEETGPVFKEVAGTLKREAAPVLRALQALRA